MTNQDRHNASLEIPIDAAYLPVATAFVENAATAMGLDKPEALSLTLATEEIITYLCRKSAGGRTIRLQCRGGVYYVAEELTFAAGDFDMRAFNLTAPASFEDESDEGEMGLLIASRVVDEVDLHEDSTGIRLVLKKEKAYPSASGDDTAKAPPGLYDVIVPDPELLKYFIRLLNGGADKSHLPTDFIYPGKVADMAASGEYGAAVACDKGGRIGGGILWEIGTGKAKMCQCFGPYVFVGGAEKDLAEALMDFCIGAVAKTQAIGIFSRYPARNFPVDYFEMIGSLELPIGSGGAMESVPIHFRQLEEDLGSVAWTHPALEPFLQSTYERLSFARETIAVHEEGETAAASSVLSVRFERTSGYASLRPLWPGKDMAENIAGHLRILRDEGIPAVFFEMDIGRSWQVRFTPALLESGFTPSVLLPHGGEGDVVIFQHLPEDRRP